MISNRSIAWLFLLFAACGGSNASFAPDAGSGPRPGAGQDAAAGSGTFGNVGVGGGQDFAAFRDALDHGLIPSPDSLDATGFFAEHYTALPAPSCDGAFCLHAMLSVSPDLARSGNWTLLQLGMNSPIDPATVAKPPLDLVVVIDRSGSMADGDKLEYVKRGVELLVDQLGEDDTLTVIAFSTEVQTLFPTQRMGSADRLGLKAKIEALTAGGSTNIYGALEQGYQAALRTGDETQQRRVIFLTDGLPTIGITDDHAIAGMSAGYNENYIGLTTIGVGVDAGLKLLRTLAEQGGGNFYFLENPAAATEVFTEELAFFVAPIAYDVDLSFDAGAPYRVAALHGTSLWRKTATGAKVHVPSVFLVSRTSTDPGESGGRRGGGSAIIAELTPIADAAPGHGVATAHLSYRLPGTQQTVTEDVPVTYGDHPGVCGEAGFYSRQEIRKNTWILGFYVAFRDATARAVVGDRAGALAILTGFQRRIEARLEGVDDEDLQADLAVLAKYIYVLSR
jgi:Ca-activated chloride channel homolog